MSPLLWYIVFAVLVAVSGSAGVAIYAGTGDGALGPAVRHPVGTQAVELGQAELQGMEAERVGHALVQAVLLPGHQVSTGRARQPVAQF